jgi:hypothetical protein
MTMTAPDVAPSGAHLPSRGRSVRAVVGAVLVAALALAFVAGLQLGKPHTTWHTGMGYLGDRQFSVEYDGWFYGAQDAVPSWIDADGSWHESGWPDCLDVVGTTLEVRFAAQEVTLDGVTSRPVVAIDCRSVALSAG